VTYVLETRAPDADHVIPCDVLNPWPAADFAELGSLLERRQASGYTVVVQRAGWTILRRPPALD